MISFCYFPSPIGRLLLVGENNILTQLHFANTADNMAIPTDWREDEAPFAPVISQLDQYFNRSKTTFDLPLDPRGTAFQQRVWQELMRIPYGETASYADIAERIGNPKACRAVGMANRRNPIPIIIPCHRVIGRDGSLTGFGGGLAVKERLLALEGVGRSVV